jgi:hypothetical protein
MAIGLLISPRTGRTAHCVICKGSVDMIFMLGYTQGTLKELCAADFLKAG